MILGNKELAVDVTWLQNDWFFWCVQVRETVLSEEQERKLLERLFREEEDERDVSGHLLGVKSKPYCHS